MLLLNIYVCQIVESLLQQNFFFKSRKEIVAVLWSSGISIFS
jgi:hypothetical protein